MYRPSNRKYMRVTSSLVFILCCMLLFSGCENRTPMEPVGSEAASIGNSQTGFSASDITWLSWNPDLLSSLAEAETANSDILARVGSEFELIEADQGGSVGGGDTYGNLVEIPSSAIDQNTWIAVQVGCPAADQFYSEYDFTELFELAGEIETRLDYLSVNVNGSNSVMNKIETAQEGIFNFQIFMEVYSYLVESSSFNILKNKIAKKMNQIVDDVGEEFEEDVEAIAVNAGIIASILSDATIEFAMTVPGYDMSKIERAMEFYDEGSEELAENDLDDIEDAVRSFRRAWNKAKDAAPGISIPSAEVDFLPDMEFLDDVAITLSWADVLLPEDIIIEDGYGVFEVFFTQDGDTWFPVEEPVIDESEQTISFSINHFTRYAWGLRPAPDDNDDDGGGGE